MTPAIRNGFLGIGAILAVSLAGTAASANGAGPGSGPGWSGCYAGLHGGYGFANLSGRYDSSQTVVGATGPTNLAKLDPDGFVGGGQAGCNFQMDNLVYGVEIDASGSGMDDKIRSNETVPDPVTADINFLASLRARLGFAIPAMGHDVLIFGTGGVAYVDWDLSATQASVVGSPKGTLHFDEFGGVVGGGIEVAVSPMISVRAEYLHYFFGNKRNTNKAKLVDSDLGDNAKLKDIGVARIAVNIKLY